MLFNIGVNYFFFFLDMSLQARETKAKQMEPNQTQKILNSEGNNQQDEKTAY